MQVINVSLEDMIEDMHELQALKALVNDLWERIVEAHPDGDFPDFDALKACVEEANRE